VDAAEWANRQEKASCVAKARKSSKSMAVQNAFAKVLICRLNGKVSVATDFAKVDPLHFNPIWETYAAGKVNKVDYAKNTI